MFVGVCVFVRVCGCVFLFYNREFHNKSDCPSAGTKTTRFAAAASSAGPTDRPAHLSKNTCEFNGFLLPNQVMFHDVNIKETISPIILLIKSPDKACNWGLNERLI